MALKIFFLAAHSVITGEDFIQEMALAWLKGDGNLTRSSAAIPGPSGLPVMFRTLKQNQNVTGSVTDKYIIGDSA